MEEGPVAGFPVAGRAQAAARAIRPRGRRRLTKVTCTKLRTNGWIGATLKAARVDN
jgi:hypothetical protein